MAKLKTSPKSNKAAKAGGTRAKSQARTRRATGQSRRKREKIRGRKR